MEQNKLDSSQIIGFLFLIGAFLWMFMFQPDFEEENKITNDVIQENIDNQNDYESTENFNSNLITDNSIKENQLIVLVLKSVFNFLCKSLFAPPPLAIISILLMFMSDEFSIKTAAIFPFELIVGILE